MTTGGLSTPFAGFCAPALPGAICPRTTEQTGLPSPFLDTLLEKVWDGKFSLLLCELYPPTVEVIERWFERDDKSQRCEATEVFEGVRR